MGLLLNYPTNMTSSDKLSLSSFIIKRAYAGYFNPAAVAPQTSAPAVVPKAIPVQAAPPPVPKAIPISAAKVPTIKKPAPVKPIAPQPSIKSPTAPPAYDLTAPYQPVLNVVAKGEAGVAGPDSMVGSNKPFGLVKKTLNGVFDVQNTRRDEFGTAAGSYQILHKNLVDLAKQHNHDPNTTLFDQATQDTYARSLMDRRGFKDFLNGKISLDQMRINLAKEWAALPAKGERSYYHGKGNNAARVSSKDINAALQKALELHRKAIKPNPTQPPLNYNAVGELP